MTERETVLLERRDRVAILTLNRPEALNALNGQVMLDVTGLLAELDPDPTVGAIVLTGSTKAFAAGADIKEMRAQNFAAVYSTNWFGDWDAISRVRTPLIAAVAGYALGGGCELAMMCDVLIAADNAVFGQPEINLGVIPGLGGSQRLTRAIGKAKAMDLILTGRNMKVDEAERAGLISRVVPVDSYLDDAVAVAATIAAMSKPVSLMAKEAVNIAFETSLTEGVHFERRLFYSTFGLDDQSEGMAAFVEKRPADFKHK